MHKVRTTIDPETEIEVDDAELLDLTRQGLILDTTAKTDEGARRAAIRQTTEKQEG